MEGIKIMKQRGFGCINFRKKKKTASASYLGLNFITYKHQDIHSLYKNFVFDGHERKIYEEFFHQQNCKYLQNV